MACCLCKANIAAASHKLTQHLADVTLVSQFEPSSIQCVHLKQKRVSSHLPAWPFLSRPPFCLRWRWHRASAPRAESLACNGVVEQSVPQRRGCTRVRAWNELWSCWCNLWLQTGRPPQLKVKEHQQGAGGRYETEGRQAAFNWSEKIRVSYSQWSQNLIPIGNPGWSEKSGGRLPVGLTPVLVVMCGIEKQWPAADMFTTFNRARSVH